MNIRLFLSLTALALVVCGCGGEEASVKSPDGKIVVQAADSTLTVCYDGDAVQTIQVKAGTLQKVSHQSTFYESYKMLTGKRSDCSNQGHSRVFTYAGNQVEVRVYDDGVAYRYLNGETTTRYIIPDGLKRWIPRFAVDYENQYPETAEARSGQYAYPSLVEYADGVFGLISEAGIEPGHCASHLVCDAETASYQIATGDEEPAYKVSPWRIIILGSLADVVESTLVTDVSPASEIDDDSWIEPGVSAWIYWAYNHSSKDFEKVREYIDLAADMGWEYNLIDWEWDQMANGGNIDDALAYARGKGVRVTLWYNSGTSWIGPGAPGPVDRLLTAESREAEFSRLEAMGVSGIKVDFFKNDGAEMMRYYIDILNDAARHHLLVDFHGCTLPRGWQRTYPNLMSMEAVYGAEWYNNRPVMTRLAASHNATLPFTRNVVGPMDYTPGTFSDSQHPHITTWAHELALPVLFESGLLHMPDRPSVYYGFSDEVRSLLSDLPSTWDDTRLLGGYPGDYVIMARRKAGKWYIAGINGTDQTRSLTLSFGRLGLEGKYGATLFKDSEDGKSIDTVTTTEIGGDTDIQCLPMGGFVMVLEKK